MRYGLQLHEIEQDTMSFLQTAGQDEHRMRGPV